MIHIDREETAKLLKRFRTENYLSHSDVAYFIGTVPNTVKQWETLNCIPSTELLLRVSMLYGVKMEELLVTKGVLEDEID